MKEKVNKSILVGLGDIGIGYDIGASDNVCFSHARALHIHPGYELICGIDPEESKRKLFEDTFLKPAFSSIEQCTDKESSDLFVISSPTDQHANNIKQILQCCDPDIILCEKPLSEDLVEAEEIIKLTKSKRVSLFVNYFRRYDPSSLEIKKIIESSLDENISVTVKYSKGFIHNGSHFFNLLEYFLDGYEGKFSSMDSNDLDPESVNVCLKFNKGKVFFIHTKDIYDPLHMDITGSFGRIHYMNGGENILYQERLVSERFKDEYVHDTSLKIINSNFLQYQWQVYEMIYNNKMSKDVSCDGDEALKTLTSMKNIMETIYGK